MGDYYERIVDLDVTGEDAAALAERAVAWLVDEGLITRETSGDGMYSLSVEEGYVAGPRWQRAVTDTTDPDRHPGPVAVIIGRDYHVGGQGEDLADRATCPRCRADTVIIDYPESFEPDEEAWRPFRQGIADWRETGVGSVSCTACGATASVTEWVFAGGFDLGALAFDFWGWPPLTDEFVAEFGRALGHRVELQSGKL